MSDPDPTDLPPAATAPVTARTILPKGTLVVVNGTVTLKLEMNAVVSGNRAEIVAADLKAE